VKLGIVTLQVCSGGFCGFGRQNQATIGHDCKAVFVLFLPPAFGYGRAKSNTLQVATMAHGTTPHFHNTEGLATIEVGSKEFQCVGALPPFDHPHVFLDMGKDSEIVCPYCSTLYVFKAELGAGHANPASAIFQANAA